LTKYYENINILLTKEQGADKYVRINYFSRNKLLISVVIFLFIIFVPRNISATEMFTVDRVNFRTAPSLTADIMTTLDIGTMVAETERRGEWSAVTVNGSEGFVANEFLGSKEAAEALLSERTPNKESLSNVNFRTAPSLEAGIMEVLPLGTRVTELEKQGEWSAVFANGTFGYIFNEFLGEIGQSQRITSPPPQAERVIVQEIPREIVTEFNGASQLTTVELLDWWAAKDIITVGANALVTDVRTGMQYYVRSFSNGVHADVETITERDTQTMLTTYGGSWDWSPRPIWVTVNGRTLAASINGVPHGGGINNENGMDGQVCIHFRGSVTNNGNRSHEADHQNAIMEAWNAAQ
jgi:uncharacterized protein YraI